MCTCTESWGGGQPSILTSWAAAEYSGRFFLQKSQVPLDSRWSVWILCVHMCISSLCALDSLPN
jgi:hypothetical protein